MTHAAVAERPSAGSQTFLTLGMSQLAPQGISEDWWLKHLGDVHWQMIANAVGQNTTVFRDRQGRQLYAAFCATDFRQYRPDCVGLGQTVEVRSVLRAAGRSRIQSNHWLMVDGETVAEFRLVSTFVAHMEAGINASVRRAAPYLVPVLEPVLDSFAQEASALAKLCRQARCEAVDHVALPTHIGVDFNAVGLLYFPSFTRLFDQVELAQANAFTWEPVKYRRVLYLGNVEMGEPVWGGRSEDHSDVFELWSGGGKSADKGLLASCLVERF